MFRVLESTALCGLELRNRFMRSATWAAMADENGAVTDRSVKLYEDLAVGGVGLIMTGYAFISKQGQATVGQLGIYSDDLIPGLRRLAQTAHEHGAKIAAQIVHAGAASTYLYRQGQVMLAPSEVEGKPPHRAMTEEEIENTINDFVAAALRAREAGFDAVQLHGAHGYLISQFFSPITNRREDRWGGSAENRRRFHVETVRRAKAAVGPDFPLMIKLGITDDDEGGASLDEGITALKAMAEAGLDAVEISGGIGSGSRTQIRVFNDDVTEVAYYRSRAAEARKAVDIPVALVGGIRSIETAEEIVASGDADLISLCRPLIREPGLIRRWLDGDQRRATCISCNKCITAVKRGEPLECSEDKRIREEAAAQW
ncbi:MAG: NADH:flavin oxidoreductase [Chloroflexi bacterium]|nr:NADH:flavin oxidoreductase [Chloroflexota bacterium]